EDEAIDEVSRSIEHGFWFWSHMKKDTDLDPIRDKKAYRKAIDKGRELEKKAFEDEEERLQEEVTKSLAGKARLPGYDWKASTIDNEEVSLAELKGKVVIVDVYAIDQLSGGPPPELPALVKLHKKYKKKGVEVVGLVPNPPQYGGRTDWIKPLA